MLAVFSVLLCSNPPPSGLTTPGTEKAGTALSVGHPNAADEIPLEAAWKNPGNRWWRGANRYKAKHDPFKWNYHCWNIHITDPRLLGKLWRPGTTFWSRKQLNITSRRISTWGRKAQEFFCQFLCMGKDQRRKTMSIYCCLPMVFITRLLMFTVIAFSRVMDQ